MGRSVLKVKGYSAEEIKSLIKRDNRYTIGIRLYAVYQVALGQSSRKLSDLYQTSFKQITNWVHRFEQAGVQGLIDKPGRGRKPRLSKEQMQELSELLLNTSPSMYGYNTETWTGPLVIDWIKNNFGLEFKRAQIYNIINQLGFSHQKAKGVYPESDPIAQEEFKEGFKKKLLSAPVDSVLLYEDEFSLANTATVSYKWGKKGKQPKIMCKQRARERRTVMGSFNYGTGQITVSFHQKGNYKSFKKHLKKILYTYKAHSKIILVLDNVRFHHARLLKDWLLNHPKLEIVYLPTYSPELNPIERAWWYMRKKITHNRFINTLEQRIKAFWKHFSRFLKPNQELLKICEINY